MNSKLTVVLGTIFVFGILENIFPFFTYKPNLLRRVSANFLLGLFNAIATSLTIVFLLKLVWQQTAWSGLLQWIQPVWLVGILSILILDAYLYFWHRWMHHWPLAWRFHRVHHTERAMNISTAYRFHAVEVILSNLPKIFLIWLFGITPMNLLIYESLFTIVVGLHHSNWALPGKVDNFLSYFIVTPNYHRIHHSQIVQETNSNYASLFSFWDRLFRTYCFKETPQTIKIGLIEESRELNIRQLLTLPFVN